MKHDDTFSMSQMSGADLDAMLLLDGHPDAVIILNATGIIQYVNAHATTILDQSTDSLAGKTFWHSASRLATNTLYQAIRNVAQTHMPTCVEYRSPIFHKWIHAYILPNREQIVLFVHESVEPGHHGQPTDDRCALIDALPYFAWTVPPDGSTIFPNAVARDYLGITEPSLPMECWMAEVHLEDRHHVEEVRRAAVRNGQPYTVKCRLRDRTRGTYRWFVEQMHPVYDATGQVIIWIGSSTDIDEQKRAGELLRQRQDRLHALMASTIMGIFIANGDEIIEANETFLQMTGYSHDDLRQHRMNWFQMTPEEYIPRMQQEHQRFTQSQYVLPYEKEYICKDGSRVPVLVGGIMASADPLEIICFVLDNSARQELEQRKDDFINTASHELRTPLTAVKLQAQLLLRRLEKRGEQKIIEELRPIEQPIKLLERLIGELLDVTRIQTGKLEYTREPVEVDGLLRRVADTLQQMNPTHRIDVQSTRPLVLLGDEGRLEQVFINLLSNAIRYSPAADHVEVIAHASAETITIRIRDHGIGISREHQEHIFERFYRISHQKEGSIAGLGIGLYITAQIIKHHKGKIVLESQPEKGSTFVVTLPRS